MKALRAAAALLAVVLTGSLAACSGPILANAPIVPQAPATPGPTRPPIADPVPITFPRDDGPHDRLTEWWYYTGHLRSDDGRRFGFEAVIFRAERGDVPVTWASHLALTDEAGGRFLYAQRSEIGPAADHSPRTAAGTPDGFALEIVGSAVPDPTAGPAKPWVLVGAGGNDGIHASLTDVEAAAAGGSFGLDLTTSSTKAPALHNGTGWVPFGPAGGSYYYSRTRLDAAGTLTLDGTELRVEGQAWFDHQWGDFISVGGGGWDWFAVNLDNGTDLTLSLVRAADGTFPLIYGTFVDADGAATHLGRGDFTVTSSGTWTSPRTGAVYPAGWQIELPSLELHVELTPTVNDQELDTRATTGVVYWEGSQAVRASIGAFRRQPVGGEGYVELTGYAP